MKRSILLTSIIFACLLGAFSTNPIRSVTAQAPSPRDSRWIEFPEMQRAARDIQSVIGVPPDNLPLPQSQPAREEVDPSLIMGWENLDLSSQLVYQQWFGDNYEIVIAGGGGGNPVRLTNNPANDMRPVISDDAAKIYFASDRDGNFEIYSMNTDGTDVRRLTNNSRTDTRPQLSPDGSHIAFISDRSGNPEVFLMKTDGSQVGQLTGAPGGNGAYDCAWSPDSTQIAFSAMNTNGLGNVYVINLKTRAIFRTHLDPLYLIYDLAWRPDLSNILVFDAISPYKVYPSSDIYSVEVNPSTILPALVRFGANPSYSDRWVSTWLHEPKYLLIEYATYTLIGDYLYLSQVSFHIVETSFTPNIVEQFEIVHSLANPGLTMDADWVRTDYTPPVSRILPLPPFSRSNPIELRLSGNQTQGAPIYSYDIYANTNYPNQNLSLLTTIPGTQSNYFTYKEPGIQAMFGVTATDDLGQKETNPPSGDRLTTTHIYQYEFSGRVMDHHGIPLGDVPINSQPSAINTPIAFSDGSFAAYLDPFMDTDIDPLNIFPGAPGYGSLPQTNFPFIDLSEITYNLYLPPQVDILQNGNFEETSLEPWTIQGDLPVSSTNLKYHTGKNSAIIGGCGANCFGSLGSSLILPDNSYPQSFITADGMGLVLNYNGNEDRLVSYQQLPDGAWSEAQEVISSSGYIAPTIIPSTNGELTACWTERLYSYSYCAQKHFGDPWGTPFQAVNPDWLSIDHLGRLMKIFTDGISYRQSDGTWLKIFDSPGLPKSPRLAFDQENNPIVVDIQSNVLVTSIFAHGIWQPLQALYAFNSADTITIEQWRTNNQGWGILMVHISNNYLIWLRSPDGIWKGPIYSINESAYYPPQIDVSPDGIAFVEDSNQLYAFDQVRGWQSIYSISGSTKVGFGLDKVGSPHVIQYFENYISDYIETYAQSRAVENGDGSLSQTVTIPADAHRPTLSFLYRLLGMQDSPGSSFEVTLSDGVDTTPLFTQTEGVSDWAHQSVDLSAWAGQTVTLNFALHQATGGTLAELDLDEVSLGDWLTPWVKSVEPNTVGVILPPLQITIHGENFANKPTVWIDAVKIPSNQVAFVDDTTLTVTLTSPSLAPGDHVIKVVNPSGYAGALSKALHTGVQVFMPTIRRQ